MSAAARHPPRNRRVDRVHELRPQKRNPGRCRFSPRGPRGRSGRREESRARARSPLARMWDERLCFCAGPAFIRLPVRRKRLSLKLPRVEARSFRFRRAVVVAVAGKSPERDRLGIKKLRSRSFSQRSKARATRAAIASAAIIGKTIDREEYSHVDASTSDPEEDQKRVKK